MRIMTHQFVRTRPPAANPPLAKEVKLAVISAMLDKKHKPRAKHVSSSPHVVLTPATHYGNS